MNNFGFIVEGVPVAKARPRFCNVGGIVKTYSTFKTKNAEGVIEWAAMQAMRANSNFDLIHVPLVIFLEFRLPIPESFSKEKKRNCQCGAVTPTVRPDLDNLAKTVLDAMNQTVYKDDKQVVDLICRKRYADKPCTIVSVKEYKNNLDLA